MRCWRSCWSVGVALGWGGSSDVIAWSDLPSDDGGVCMPTRSTRPLTHVPRPYLNNSTSSASQSASRGNVTGSTWQLRIVTPIYSVQRPNPFLCKETAPSPLGSTTPYHGYFSSFVIPPNTSDLVVNRIVEHRNLLCSGTASRQNNFVPGTVRLCLVDTGPSTAAFHRTDLPQCNL
jgi:hypothetical protein